ncbi:MAG: TonB-dependent receptor [Paludibacteraceae bacterium]|nr:TonB-dependent receptor [Paludibacteraceae bacterium]
MSIKRCLLSLLCMSAGVLHAQDTLRSVVLDEVVTSVTKSPADVRRLPLTVSIVGPERLGLHHANSVLGTLSEEVPGLYVTQRGMMGYGVQSNPGGTIKIRGVGGMANLLVLIDGQPQYAGLYGHPIADNYQTTMTERVEVIRGPASLYYGSNAMGGVVNIVTGRAAQYPPLTTVSLAGGSYGTFDVGAQSRMKRDRFSVAVGLQYNRTDGQRSNMDFEQYAGYLSLGYDLGSHWQTLLNGNLNYFNSSNPGKQDNPITDNDMHVMRYTVAAGVQNSYEHTSGSLRMYYNGGHHRIDNGYRPQDGEMPSPVEYVHNDLMAGVSAVQTFRFFPGNQTTFGADWQIFGGHAWNQRKADKVQTADLIRKTQHELAAYVDFRQQLASWLSADVGFRYDHHSQTGGVCIPQGGLAFVPAADAQVKAVVGRGFRNPTIRELYMYAPANDDLKPENMMNYELSYQHHLLGRRLMFGANLFYLHADNLIETRVSGGQPLNVNMGRIDNAGLELEAHCSVWKGWYLSANYSYLYMDRPVEAAPEHKLYVAARYEHRHFGVHTALTCIGGMLKVDGNGAKTGYAMWNAGADWHLNKYLSLYVTADNLLAVKYEIIDGFPMPRTTFMGGMTVTF